MILIQSLIKTKMLSVFFQAFSVAKQELGIAEFLDPKDMVDMRVPDKLCIFTYVSQYYNYFHDKEPRK